MEDKSLTDADVPLAHVERGSGPAVCLLHGFPLDHRIWSAQVRELSDRFRVVAPDLIGFGKSGLPAAFTMESQADAVHQLLARLNALPCILMGLSMGGYVALAFAERYPADLRALGLISTKAAADDAAARRARNKTIETARTKGVAAVVEAMLPKVVGPRTPRENVSAFEKLRTIMSACPAETIAHASAAMRDRPDRTALLPTLAVRALVLAGEEDGVTPPAGAREMAAALPHATLVLVPRAGHMLPIESPQFATAAIREFLAGAR